MNKEFIENLLYLGIAYYFSNLIPMFFIYGRKNVSDKEMDSDYKYFKIIRYVLTIFVFIILLFNLLKS